MRRACARTMEVKLTSTFTSFQDRPMELATWFTVGPQLADPVDGVKGEAWLKDVDLGGDVGQIWVLWGEVGVWRNVLVQWRS